MKKETEFVILHESVIQSWVRDSSTFALFASLIGVGIYLDSSAMQWIGFFVAVITIMARSSGKVKRMTKQQAIDYLNSLD